MKTNLYRNCSLMRIPVKKGVKDYYFPTNVDWVGKKVDKIVAFISPERNYLFDPVDGVTPVMGDFPQYTGNVFFSLYDTDNREVCHNISLRFISQICNNSLELNCVLNLSLCRVMLTTEPDRDYTILVYVFHGTRTEENGELPRRAISTRFTLEAAQELTLRQLIHDYVHALPGKIKGVYMTRDALNCYLTLRDKQLTYTMDDVIGYLMRPIWADIFDIGIHRPVVMTTAIQTHPFLLDNLDVDFDNSYIRNGRNVTADCEITFLY